MTFSTKQGEHLQSCAPFINHSEAADALSDDVGSTVSLERVNLQVLEKENDGKNQGPETRPPKISENVHVTRFSTSWFASDLEKMFRDKRERRGGEQKEILLPL